MVTNLKEIDAFILIGGQSRRMNADKSLVQLKGKTLTEIIHQKLESIFNNINVVGKKNNFADYNFVNDIKHIQCPLNGITTALEHSNSDWIFIIACDLPLVKNGVIKYLYNNIDANVQVVLPNVNNHLQPLCTFYHKSVLENFSIAIDKGEYSLMKLLGQIAIKKVSIPTKNKEQFLNINYPNDLEKAEILLR